MSSRRLPNEEEALNYELVANPNPFKVGDSIVFHGKHTTVVSSHKGDVVVDGPDGLKFPKSGSKVWRVS